MKNIKIEFRCTEEEKKRVYKQADNQGKSVRDYILDSTIYKRGRSGLNTKQKAALCRIKTILNKVDSGVGGSEEMQKMLEEVRELCQS